MKEEEEEENEGEEKIFIQAAVRARSGVFALITSYQGGEQIREMYETLATRCENSTDGA